MIIIGISGHKESGKTTVAKYLELLLPFRSVVHINFADALKEEVARATGTTVAFINENKAQFRPILQWWGTEWRRNYHGKGYWLTKWMERVRDCDKEVVLVSDVRFQNELDICNELRAVTVRVRRATEFDPHQSETELDKAQFNYYIHNHTDLVGLKHQVNELHEELKKTNEQYKLICEKQNK